jgi:ABC-type Zn uptake system ZnuABC Zn-binding protein ZnuA
MIFMLLLVTLIVVPLVPGKAMVQADTHTTQTSPKNGTLKVVTTISILEDWADQIGKNLWTAQSIVPAFKNPHTYEGPSGTEVEAIKECDMFICMGIEGLEPWLESIIDATGLPADKIVTLVNSSMIEYDDVIKSNNPHVWMSPIIAKDMVDKIYEKCVEKDPSNEVTYTSNRNSYHAELDALLSRIEGNKTANFDGMKVVVHHPAFKYLFDLLGIERVASIEEQEGVEPSAQHIAEVTEKMREENVTVIVHQPQLRDDNVNQIARDTGAKIALLTPLPGVEWKKLVVEPEELGLDPGEEILKTYIDMIDYNLIALANPFDPPEKGNIITWVLAGVGIVVIVALMVVLVYYRRRPV